MRRLDQALVEIGLAPSRSRAQALIAAGAVRLDGELRIAEAVEPMGWVLKHGTLATRWAAVQTLGKLGALARPAVPALKELLVDTDDAELRAEIDRVRTDRSR